MRISISVPVLAFGILSVLLTLSQAHARRTDEAVVRDVVNVINGQIQAYEALLQELDSPRVSIARKWNSIVQAGFAKGTPYEALVKFAASHNKKMGEDLAGVPQPLVEAALTDPQGSFQYLFERPLDEIQVYIIQVQSDLRDLLVYDTSDEASVKFLSQNRKSLREFWSKFSEVDPSAVPSKGAKSQSFPSIANEIHSEPPYLYLPNGRLFLIYARLEMVVVEILDAEKKLKELIGERPSHDSLLVMSMSRLIASERPKIVDRFNKILGHYKQRREIREKLLRVGDEKITQIAKLQQELRSEFQLSPEQLKRLDPFSKLDKLVADFVNNSKNQEEKQGRLMAEMFRLFSLEEGMGLKNPQYRVLCARYQMLRNFVTIDQFVPLVEAIQWSLEAVRTLAAELREPSCALRFDTPSPSQLRSASVSSLTGSPTDEPVSEEDERSSPTTSLMQGEEDDPAIISDAVLREIPEEDRNVILQEMKECDRTFSEFRKKRKQRGSVAPASKSDVFEQLPQAELPRAVLELFEDRKIYLKNVKQAVDALGPSIAQLRETKKDNHWFLAVGDAPLVFLSAPHTKGQSSETSPLCGAAVGQIREAFREALKMNGTRHH